MNLPLFPLLADAAANLNYWPLRYFVCLIWAGIFAVIGLGMARMFWEGRRNQAREIERENVHLRRERDDLERQLEASR